MVVADGDLLVLLDGALLNAADGDAADEFVVVNGGDQHLEGLVRLRLRGGDIAENGLKQGLQVGPQHVGVPGTDALAGGTEEHGGVQLLLCGIQVQQQLQHFVHDLVDTLVRAVNLVDDHDHPMAQVQGTGEDEAGLGHGPFGGVHQEDDAVDHFQNPLHLAAEVSVARGVYNIDLHIAVLDGGVFGQNGNAALPLQVPGVHDPVLHFLVLPEGAALLEHLVHQGGLAMVHVGDDGDVSQ